MMRSRRHPVVSDRPLPAACCCTQEEVGGTGLAALARVLDSFPADRLLGRGEARAADRALRADTRRLAADARAADPVRAERLLTELRRAWRDLPAVRRVPDGRRGALWDRLVRLCCEEFYPPPAHAGMAPLSPTGGHRRRHPPPDTPPDLKPSRGLPATPSP